MPDFLSKASYRDPRRTTYAAAGWLPLVDPAGPGPIIRTRLDEQANFQHRIVARDGETYGYRLMDAQIARYTTMILQSTSPDASFIYLGEVDEAGHMYGGKSRPYAETLTRVDTLVGDLLHAIETASQTRDEDWLIVVTTDHGHTDEGGHGGAEDIVRRSFIGAIQFGPHVGQPDMPRLAPHEVTNWMLDFLV